MLECAIRNRPGPLPAPAASADAPPAWTGSLTPRVELHALDLLELPTADARCLVFTRPFGTPDIDVLLERATRIAPSARAQALAYLEHCLAWAAAAAGRPGPTLQRQQAQFRRLQDEYVVGRHAPAAPEPQGRRQRCKFLAEMFNGDRYRLRTVAESVRCDDALELTRLALSRPPRSVLLVCEGPADAVLAVSTDAAGGWTISDIDKGPIAQGKAGDRTRPVHEVLAIVLRLRYALGVSVLALSPCKERKRA